MSTSVDTKMTDHILTEYWGGDTRGICIQITASSPISNEIDTEGYIQLTMREAAILAKDLSEFVMREATRRQDLLKQQLKDMKDMERTVFHEISNLKMSDYETQELVVGLVDSFCPKIKSRGMNHEQE